MQDLTARYNIALAPSSQEGGNLIQPNLAEMTMTAPGSQPVTPLPPPAQGSNVPEPHEGPRIPVSSPRPQPSRAPYRAAADWQETPDPDDQPRPSPAWKQL